jgi:hypothetical protein
MNNIVLVNSDKTLEKTTFRTIYQKENRADTIQFLIDPSFLDADNIENSKILLQVLLPQYDAETERDTTGKMRYMTLDEDTYYGLYKTELPITTTLTAEAGQVELWFMFFDFSDVEKIKLTKTGSCFINIRPSSNVSSEDLEDNESYDVVANLQNQIDELNENKIDKQFFYDEETNTIQFYANGEAVGSPIKLDDEISWKNWED